MQTFNDRLKEFMRRSICYGDNKQLNSLISHAENYGCITALEVLSKYLTAINTGDKVTACKCFAALHFFTCA